ncbi:MAG: type I-E CRISPR-associated protein Cas5/CasD [Candidatus Sigynarchaeota archaeon]
MASPALLMLRLEGHLQSWGSRARWSVRDTAREPTKSGIIGLIGCALGYPRGDARLSEELDPALVLAIREDRPGVPLQDFHTIKGFPRSANGSVKTGDQNAVNRPWSVRTPPYHLVSVRDYLQDASFIAVLSGERTLLERCQRALREPRWPLYLGRRSCVPSTPVCIGITTEYDSLREALERYPWRPRTIREQPPPKLRCIEEKADGRLRRQDRPAYTPGRAFGFRQVEEYWVPPVVSRGD